MKKSIITFVASLAVFLLAMSFSISTPAVYAQAVNCPAGYTCTPIASQPTGCPVGYVCTLGNVSSVISSSPSITNSCYSLPTNLYLGSTGNTVTNLQIWLINNGFNIPAISSGKTATGYYGSQTVSAIARYKMSSRYLSCLGSQNQAPVITSPTNPVTYIPPVSSSPTQSTISANTPMPGDNFMVGNTVPIIYGTNENGISGSFSVSPAVSSSPTVYCPATFTCVPISSQYPPIPTASGPATSGSCPTGYNCYPISVNPSPYSPVPNQISSCATISQPGIYQLTQNITTSGDCFKISSSNVVIDGEGHSVIGDGSTGYGISVNLGGLSNIRITNISISNFAGNNNSLTGNDSSDISNQSSVATISPSSVTINSGQNYTFTLGFPSDSIDNTITASCPSYVIGANCNTGPRHGTKQTMANMSFDNYLGDSIKQVTVIYNAVTPNGNTSAQALINVLPGTR